MISCQYSALNTLNPFYAGLLLRQHFYCFMWVLPNNPRTEINETQVTAAQWSGPECFVDDRCVQTKDHGDEWGELKIFF